MDKQPVTLILPSCGLNHLWQLGAIRALYDLGIAQRVKTVYGSSGGAWSAIFMGLGLNALDDYIERAPNFYSRWHQKNKYKYLRKMTNALHNDSRTVLQNYDFFNGFKPNFECYFKLLQIYPSADTTILKVNSYTPEKIHKLAIASSTIPLVTGTVAKVGKKLYLDGGFRLGFDHDSLINGHNPTLILDPRAKTIMHNAYTISPQTPLPSGLQLGLPFKYPSKRVQDLIDCGYNRVVELEEKITMHTNQSNSQKYAI